MVLRWSRMQKLRVSQRRRGWHETVSCSGSAFSRVSFGEQVVEKIAQTRHPRAARTVVLRNGSSVLLPAWRRASLSCVHAQRCGPDASGSGADRKCAASTLPDPVR